MFNLKQQRIETKLSQAKCIYYIDELCGHQPLGYLDGKIIMHSEFGLVCKPISDIERIIYQSHQGGYQVIWKV